MQLKPYDYFLQLERPASWVFGAMETRGICIDRPYLVELKGILEAQEQPLKEAILNEFGPINLDSPPQLLGALKAKGISPEYKGKLSTDQRGTLYTIYKDEPIVKLFKEWNELNTLLKNFVYSYLDRQVSVLHCFFNQCGTRTGRPSCSNPNLLQIPRRTANGKLVRRMFVPREGFVMGDCDFGQIEPRVLAHLSKDQAMCQMFNEGIDFHTFTSDRLRISREKAKVLNLSVGYRATFKSVSTQLKCSKEEAVAQIKAWWDMFPQLRRWQEKLIYESKKSGFCTTLLGRRIKVDNLEDGNPWRREAAERQLINNVTQGSAAEIMKAAMVNIHNSREVTLGFGLLVQVYDELVWESRHPEYDAPLVKYEMENAIKLDVPLTVDCKTGPDWSSCH